MATSIKNQLREYCSRHPQLKTIFLRILFRKKPYQTQLRGLFWLFFVMPKYLRRGISLRARLDLVPFNRFRLGRGAKIEKNVIVNNGMGDIIIGKEAQIGVGSVIIGPVKTGRYCGLSQYVRLLGMHHGLDPIRPHHHLPCTQAPIELGEDVFIGTGTVVLGKKNGDTLRLGDYCRIGANSVVVDDIPPCSIAVGNPARVIKKWNFETNSWDKAAEQDTNNSTTFSAITMQSCSSSTIFHFL